MKKAVILFLLALQGLAVLGQDTTAWTLEKCIAAALENNLEVRRKELQAQGAGADALQSRLNLLPNANYRICNISK